MTTTTTDALHPATLASVLRACAELGLTFRGYADDELRIEDSMDEVVIHHVDGVWLTATWNARSQQWESSFRVKPTPEHGGNWCYSTARSLEGLVAHGPYIQAAQTAAGAIRAVFGWEDRW